MVLCVGNRELITTLIILCTRHAMRLQWRHNGAVRNSHRLSRQPAARNSDTITDCVFLQHDAEGRGRQTSNVLLVIFLDQSIVFLFSNLKLKQNKTKLNKAEQTGAGQQ